jgi:hypothetical protein
MMIRERAAGIFAGFAQTSPCAVRGSWNPFHLDLGHQIAQLRNIL